MVASVHQGMGARKNAGMVCSQQRIHDSGRLWRGRRERDSEDKISRCCKTYDDETGLMEAGSKNKLQMVSVYLLVRFNPLTNQKLPI